MSEKYAPKKGDRVRIVLEGEVGYMDDDAFEVGTSSVNFIVPRAEHVVSIEKVEPPVVKFKPGQVVRHKDHRDFIYTVGTGGYLDNRTGTWWKTPRNNFTSAHYEPVDLG